MTEIKAGDCFRAVGEIPPRLRADPDNPLNPDGVLLFGRSRVFIRLSAVDYLWHMSGECFCCDVFEELVEASYKAGELRLCFVSRMFHSDTVQEEALDPALDVVFSGVRFQFPVRHNDGTRACGGSVRFAAESAAIEACETDDPIFVETPNFLKSRVLGGE